MKNFSRSILVHMAFGAGMLLIASGNSGATPLVQPSALKQVPALTAADRNDLLVRIATSNSADLSWNNATDSRIVGYKVYMGGISGNYTQSVDVGTATSYSFTGLSSGRTYYFAVTAYDKNRNESAFSKEVKKQIPLKCQMVQVPGQARPQKVCN